MLKEWQIMTKDVNTLMLVTVLPLLIVGQMLLYIWLAVEFATDSALNLTIFQNALVNLIKVDPAVGALSGGQQFQVLLLSQFNFYMLLIPVMIAVSLSTFSIVDEKLTGSLEALLATPVKTWELLLGKALSGAVPALLVTWLCSAIFILAVVVMGWGDLLGMVTSPVWYIGLFIFTPVVTVLSFLLGVIGSARAKDAKSAQNLVIFIILPVLALIVVQLTGVIWFNTLSALILALALIIIVLAVMRIAVKLFQRESIVISWR
jgi:ABC-2 type transport system permease protein